MVSDTICIFFFGLLTDKSLLGKATLINGVKEVVMKRDGRDFIPPHTCLIHICTKISTTMQYATHTIQMETGQIVIGIGHLSQTAPKGCVGV